MLYESLTGHRAFPGETISDILAELIKSEPDWSRLPAATPAAVRRLLRRCPARGSCRTRCRAPRPQTGQRAPHGDGRGQGAGLRARPRRGVLGDAALELAEADEPPVAAAAEAAAARPAGRSRGLAIAGVLAGLAVGLVLGTLWMRHGDEGAGPPSRPPVTAGVVELPATAPIAYGTAPIGYDSPMLTISADGRYVVYVGRDGEGSRLYRHDLSTFSPPEPIPGTEGALHAFFSPSEPAVGFVTSDKLARIDVNGDRLQVLGDVRAATRAIWADDGHIYVGDSQAQNLLRFPENGGDAALIGELPSHGLSDVLPGGTWSRRGELFYRLGDRWYVVETTSGDTFSWTPPRLAFEIAFLDTPGMSYAVTGDGQRLYTIVQAQADVEDRIHVIGGLIGP